jgi:hypothetical protein
MIRVTIPDNPAHCAAPWIGLGRMVHGPGFDMDCLTMPQKETVQ